MLLHFPAVYAQPTTPITFADVVRPAGIDFVHINGSSGRFYYVESMGSGVCLFDYDGDGWTDIYFVNGARLPGSPPGAPATNALYRNQRDGTFENVTAKAGVGDLGYGTGACAADYDNDGDLDLHVLNFGPDVFYRNNGDGTFTDITQAAGVADSGWSVSGTFFDYDRDGHLDLFVARYLKYGLEDRRACRHRVAGREVEDYCGPDNFDGLPDRLFRNLGNGKFADVSIQTGIAGRAGKGMGVGVADFDDDGWPDLFVANDQQRNHLYRNQKGKTFEEDGVLSGVALDDGGGVQASMGVAWGDVDNDGRLDLFVPCLRAETFPLYRNEGDGFFTDIARRTGIAAATLPYTGFGAILADFDNDGWLDAFMANGAVFAREGRDPKTDSFIDCYGEKSLLLHNQAGKRFRNVSAQAAAWFREPHVGRGAAVGDLFNDGRLCIVVNNSGDRPALLRQPDSPKRHHWLTIKTVGRKSNRDGIGARITVHAGSLRMVREVTAGSSIFSQNDIRAHFGLAEHDHADRIDITWPSGIRQTITNVKADQVLTVTEPDA